MPNIIRGGEPNVVLIAGGGKVYTDIATRFCGSEKSIEDIISSEYNPQIVKNILERGHLAATEFDFFIFGIERVSRVTEIQLVRKRLASYLIKSGRMEKGGKRSFDVIKPPSYEGVYVPVTIPYSPLVETQVDLTYEDLMGILEQFYNGSIEQGIPEQDARFSKPQGTETKIIIGMNCHSLLDWFKIRCCDKAQWEIRTMAQKMLKLCKDAKPDLFEKAGRSCDVLGYCPEGTGQCEGGKWREVPTLDKLLRNNKLNNKSLSRKEGIEDTIALIDKQMQAIRNKIEEYQKQQVQWGCVDASITGHLIELKTLDTLKSKIEGELSCQN